MPKNRAEWGTQGGGRAAEIDGRLVYIEAPHPSVGLNIGDEVPAEWGLIPANAEAGHVMDPSTDPDEEYKTIMAGFRPESDPRHPAAIERFLAGGDLPPGARDPDGSVDHPDHDSDED